ncbi:copper amine oxidase N-terminal domain-containing protein [Paenibacillus sp. P96]|uniref:Copper amine oxidase N-terminal domain-containing protein n=1 Tax=Paenibacillus zeirhizosphaerae TaxID=2987519 RepID=A0ABT9FT51_9BACL|nr:stalk domain-containing protein [Paenibacillus sp. P96]MDP4097903.1 copper amine oxidase N-terminal domain-containing protein [Paenibacillus sp. P96]
MKFKKKPMVMTALSVLTVSGALFSQSTYAAEAAKTIKAVYNNIGITYNGTAISYDALSEPFMINGTTYLPLRLVGTALNKNVTWDGTNKRVIIADNGSVVDQSTITALNNQMNTLNQELTATHASLTSKTAEIVTLQADIEKLKAEQNHGGDLDKIEEKLNDLYGNYKKTDSEISLSGDTDDITVRIDVDKSEWRDLTTSSKTSLLQDIVDDLLDEYEDADISGGIYDSSKLDSFSVSSSGKVSLSGSTVKELDEMEDELKDDHNKYKNTDARISLGGDEDDITVRIDVDENGWNDLAIATQKRYLQGIVDDLLAEYEGAKITGKIYDSTRLASFTVSSSGKVNLSTDVDLQDIVNQLSNDYGNFYGATFSIKLEGEANDSITIKAYVSKEDWDALSSYRKNQLKSGLLKDALEFFPDAVVYGYIYNKEGTGSYFDRF